MIDPDLRYLLAEDSTVDFSTFELVEELKEETPEETWYDAVVVYTIIGILIALPI